jgi:hypothetical protein
VLVGVLLHQGLQLLTIKSTISHMVSMDLTRDLSDLRAFLNGLGCLQLLS